MYDGEKFEIEDEEFDEEGEGDEDCMQAEAAAAMAEGKSGKGVKADYLHPRDLSEAQVAERIRSSERSSAELLDNFVKNPNRDNLDDYIGNLVNLYQLRRLGGNPAGGAESTLEDGVKAANEALKNAGSNLRIELSGTHIPKGSTQFHFQVMETTNNQTRMVYENSAHLIGRPLDALGGDAIYNPELIRPSYAGPWANRR